MTFEKFWSERGLNTFSKKSTYFRRKIDGLKNFLKNPHIIVGKWSLKISKKNIPIFWSDVGI